MARLCKLCNQRVATSKHHLYPVEISCRYSHLDGNGVMHTKVNLCKGCHHAIHKFFTNRQLFDYYNSIARLLAHPRIKRRLKMMETYPTGYSSKGFNIPQRVNSQDVKIAAA